ncbi:3-methylorcinaldehyde synthase [Lachnellula arida]|uniref:3-methylorcinaldehyde synthase n=1 Tax=Lachnellula arida TaxID=1316785 RepID=A0A8T9BFL9_9HELO|nr:3-methylorcinaldehyde synthase [Lachnellula arida]
MASSLSGRLPSLAVFGPQSKIPTEAYLSELRTYIREKAVFEPLVQAIRDLPLVWQTHLSLYQAFAPLEDVPRYLQTISDWVSGDGPMGDDRGETPSGVSALPMLLVIHLAQYFMYLEQKKVTHSELMQSFRNGAGIQGYCGGMFAAVSVACAKDEKEIIFNACGAICLAVGVGAAADTGDENPSKLPCIMVLRLKYEGQGDEILKAFPGTHISAITDPKTLSLVGPPQVLLEVEKFAIERKVAVHLIPLRGKMHSPDNAKLAKDFTNFCNTHEQLKIPDSSGYFLEIARVILVDKCDWYQLLIETAKDLSRTGQTEHSFASFGIGDCVSLQPYRQASLKLKKLDMFALLDNASHPTINPQPPFVEFPESTIAVVGMACRFPGANTVEELWEVIKSGRSMVQEVPEERINFQDNFRFRSDQRWASKQKFYGGFISDHDCFDNAFFNVGSREAIYMDPQQCLLLETAYQAMESSGYLTSSQSRDSGDRVGVFIGASFDDYLEHTSASTPSAYTATGTLRAFLSGKISHYFGWTGPSEVIDTACSSSLVAISHGVRALQRNECKIALVGGVNFMSAVTHFLDLGRASFLSPTGQCKPFDAAADGYCRGEGVGLIVLKPLAEAIANNDQIFGVIPGISTNQGSDPKSITVPYSTSQVQLFNSVFQEATIDPSLITYVEAHGTGTQAGDPIEMSSIRQVLSTPTREHPINVGSIKANIGHAETSAGVAGVIKALLILNKGILPPLANFKCLNPKIPALEVDKIVISKTSQPWNVPFRGIMVNGYGASGSNAALLLCQSPRKFEKLASEVEGTPSFPIILTAASKASLQMYAKSLKNHLQTPEGSYKNIADVALTLSKHRKCHRFAYTTTASGIRSLTQSLDNLDTISELQKTPKKVVLAFSGQSARYVGLDKRFYDSCPTLQNHLSRCNQYLIDTGSPSIFPSIFETEPLSDIVELQCGMFALQYSCARSWIDSGLKVDAVIGHSFGELTAMAVSGVLSLEGAINIIRARAKLIQVKWGSEAGAMLVIHDTQEVVHEVLAHLAIGSEKVEIACYNGPTSHVLVGTSASIAEVETILRTEPKFGSLRSSKVNTTHGFHSWLTDGLLSDLDAIAKQQTFSTPHIPIETCTIEKSAPVSFERISQHMREPVFFLHAVTRLEEKLGTCVWLEAGTNSPIIPMIRRAVKSQQHHVFLPIKFYDGQDPIATISDVTAKLWLEGISLSYINFGNVSFKQVWLPPYAFERTSNWLPYVDPVKEALHAQQLQQHLPEPQHPAEIVPLRLVNPCLGTPKQFSIGTHTERFQSIVNGHNVIGNPLCPAALYLEAAIMAVQSSMGNLEKHSLSFWDFRIEAPLGIDHRRNALITLEGNGEGQDWSFVLTSSVSGQPNSKPTIHAKAGFKFAPAQSVQELRQFQYYQRFANARLAAFQLSADTETIKMSRAYKLFARVVNYSSIFKGMYSLTIVGNEVLAELELPAASETDESSAVRSCDTIALDNFVQVIGLLMNTSDICTEDEAFLAVGADNITMSPICDLESVRKYRVFASFTSDGSNKATGDIFVLTADSTLVAVITGMHFSKIPLHTLQKILASASEKKSQMAKVLQVTPAIQVTKLTATTSENTHVPSSPLSINNKESPKAVQYTAAFEVHLKKVISEFAGIGEEHISSGAIIGDLGVDSLAAIELVAELQSQFGIELSSTDITTTTISALAVLSIACSPGSASTKTSVGSSSVAAFSPGKILTPSTDGSKSPSKISVEETHIYQLISEYATVEASSIMQTASLEELGVDSLSLIELKSAVEEACGVEVAFDPSITVGELLSLLGHNSNLPSSLPTTSQQGDPHTPAALKDQTSHLGSKPMTDNSTAYSRDPLDALENCKVGFDTSAELHGLAGYYENVLPKQNELVIAYIVEAFQELGTDLTRLRQGDNVPEVTCLSKHAKLMARLWEILEEASIVQRVGPRFIRSVGLIPTQSSIVLLELLISLLISSRPQFAIDLKLLSITGPHLAECLLGTADAVKLIFGNPSSKEILSRFYSDSPMFSTSADLLPKLIDQVVPSSSQTPFQILEVGGGTGSATACLVEVLQSQNRSVQYTFTDISPTFITAAKKRFAHSVARKIRYGNRKGHCPCYFRRHSILFSNPVPSG